VSNESNVELIRKLYAELAAVLTVDAGDRQRAGSFLMLDPLGGAILDPDLNFADPADRALLINNIADITIREGWLLTKAPRTMSSTYNTVLKNRATPAFRMTPEEEAEFNEIERLLYKLPSRKRTEDYDFYEDALDELIDAIETIQVFEQENFPRRAPLSAYRALRRAKTTFENDARGIFFKGRLDRHVELQNRRGTGWFSDLQDIFDANFNLNGNFAEAQFFPRFQQWFNNARKWNKVKIELSDLETRTHNSNTNFSSGLGAQWGLLRIGGRYGSDEVESFKQETITSLTLEFELLSVFVRFPWMEFGLFESRAWRHSSASPLGTSLLSDGIYNPDAPSARDERLPFVPTTLLLARNVTLSASWSFDMNDFIEKRKNAGGSFSFGPFSFGGRYQNTDQKNYVIAQHRGVEIKLEDPQALGYFVYQVPKSPDPDLSLPWPRSPERLRALEASAARYPAAREPAVLERANTLLTSAEDAEHSEE